MSKYKKISAMPAIGITPTSLINIRIDADYYKPMFIENEERLYNSGIKIQKLGDMWVEGNYGSLPDSTDYVNKGVGLLRGRDLHNYTITSEEKIVKVTNEYYDKYRKARVTEGDILLLVKGASIDRHDSAAIVPKMKGKTIINGSIFRIKLKEIYDKYYTLGFLFSDLFLLQKRRAVTNTGALYNDIETIKGYYIPVPEKKIQSYIGSKVRLAERCRVGAEQFQKKSEDILHKQIGLKDETNRSDNSTSFHLLFKSDKSFAERITPELIGTRLDPIGYHPDCLNLIASLQKADSEVRHIKSIGVFETKNRENVEATHCDFFISILHVDNKGIIDWNSAKRHKPEGKGLFVKKGDILISKINPKENRICVADGPHVKENTYIACSKEFSIFRSHLSSSFYISFFLRSIYGYQQLFFLGRGTSSSRRRICEDDLYPIYIPIIDYYKQINLNIKKSTFLYYKAYHLITQAKSDVEKLIEGKLDTQGIISGRIKAPTWKEVEALIENEIEE